MRYFEIARHTRTFDVLDLQVCVCFQANKSNEPLLRVLHAPYAPCTKWEPKVVGIPPAILDQFFSSARFLAASLGGEMPFLVWPRVAVHQEPVSTLVPAATQGCPKSLASSSQVGDRLTVDLN